MDCLPKSSDPEIEKMKPQMAAAFQSAVGMKELQDKDNAAAAKDLRAAVDSSPDTQKDFGLVYPLALAYLGLTPPDYQNGIWFAARAAAVAPPTAQAQIEKYAHGQYMKYRQDEEGWPEVLAAAKAGAAQVPIKPPLTPADQAHRMVLATPPDKMDFAQWEFILSNG